MNLSINENLKYVLYFVCLEIKEKSFYSPIGEPIFYRVNNNVKSLKESTPSDDIELYLWGKTLIRYKEEILNYFVYRTTNAYTEGLHVRCKLVQRISCGFRNAEVYIRKALLVLLPLSVAITNSYYLSNHPL